MRSKSRVAGAVSTMAVVVIGIGVLARFTAAAESVQEPTLSYIAKLQQGYFSGDEDDPQLGDTREVNADIYDHDGDKVGYAASTCIVVQVEPRDPLVQCQTTIVLDNGSITVGGLAPLGPLPSRLAVFGGTGDYMEARGEEIVTLEDDGLHVDFYLTDVRND